MLSVDPQWRRQGSTTLPPRVCRRVAPDRPLPVRRRREISRRTHRARRGRANFLTGFQNLIHRYYQANTEFLSVTSSPLPACVESRSHRQADRSRSPARSRESSTRDRIRLSKNLTHREMSSDNRRLKGGSERDATASTVESSPGNRAMLRARKVKWSHYQKADRLSTAAGQLRRFRLLKESRRLPVADTEQNVP